VLEPKPQLSPTLQIAVVPFMPFRRTIIRGLPAAVASLILLAAGAAGAQDPTDPTNPFTQDEPLIPPTPYQSSLGTIYVASDLVGFARLDPKGTFATANRTTTVLSGDNLDYVHTPGMRTMVGLRLNDYYALETTYLGLFDWDVQNSVRNVQVNLAGTAGNLYSPFTNFGSPPQAGLDFNNFVSVASETEFDTGELNVRQRVDLPSSGFQAAGLWGLRYIGLSDRFSYRSRSVSPAPSGSVVANDVNAYNRMLGAQFGGAFEMHVERRAWVNLEAKGMVLTNDSSQSSHFAAGPPGAAATTSTVGEQSQRRVSFGADVQATLSWRFSPAIVGRLGYQALFLDGVALGDDNFLKNARNATVSPSELANDGNMTFHGPFTGVTFTW
jgi:hypothetical protein